MQITSSKLHEIFATNPDTERLKLFDLFMRERLYEAHKRTQARRKLINDVRDLAEGGKVALVNGGMDCDCSRWENSVSMVPATVRAVDEWIESFYEHAEGPQWHYVERPSVARTLRASSRDLALEAFEDGHQHVVYA